MRTVVLQFLTGADTSRCLLAAVGPCLHDSVGRGQVLLEEVCGVERFFNQGLGCRTETTHHDPFIMRQGVAMLVELASEAFEMILATLDRTFLRAHVLVG